MSLVSNIEKIKNSRVLFVIALILVFILTLNFNFLYPLYADDWSYSFVFGEDNSNRITSLMEVFRSQKNHYFMWGGRVVLTAIAQILLMFEPYVQDIVNALAYILLVLMIYVLSFPKSRTNLFLLVFIVGLHWLCTPDFVACTFWLTGSCVYLWGTLFLLCYIYPFVLVFMGKKIKTIKGFPVIMLIAGVISGCTLEAPSLAILFMQVCIIGCLFYKKESIPVWMWFASFGFVIGMVFLFVAPGNFIRAEVVNEMMGDRSFMQLLSNNIKDLWQFSTKRDFLIVTIVLYGILFFFGHKNKYDKRLQTVSLLFFVSGMLSFAAMCISPTFPARAMFPGATFILVANAILFSSIKYETKKIAITNTLLCLLILVPYALEYNRREKRMSKIANFWKKREQYIISEREKGNKNIVLTDKFDFARKRDFIEELSVSPDDWKNVDYARFLSVDSISVKK